MNSKNEVPVLRKTEQMVLPHSKAKGAKGAYDIYPAFEVEEGSLKQGWNSLAKWIVQHQNVVIDGYVGVFWEQMHQALSQELSQMGITVNWCNVGKAMKSSADIDSMIAPFLGGDDPVFGTRCTLELVDFFNSEELSGIKPDASADVNIVYGCGASLCGWDAPVVYIDLPKNELQFRMRAESITNLGAVECYAPKAMYKRFYFVDWVVLNSHKQQLLPTLDVVVDGQHPERPVWTRGEVLRDGLRAMGNSVFRVRPWFEPGVWGGNWIKDNIPTLPQNVPNYAWSFELIVPENGLLFGDGSSLMEVSFDMLMFQESQSVLGEATTRFGVEFPIRFDFLDTFDGGNLSVQVHPKPSYIKKEFGENFTQDETYYILDAKDDAQVYLGFQQDIQPRAFEQALTSSFDSNQKLDITTFVQSHQASKHDLFLIPSGTIHGAGINNMVLEISSTPYIFTFKMYDWLRPDLDGRPRPLNIQRGMKNLNFDRQGEMVKRDLIAKSNIIDEGDDWRLVHLKTHEDHFYDVHRMEFNTQIEVDTNNQCHVMSLVEGESVRVITKSGRESVFNYAETFVIPANAGSYRLVNEGATEAKVVKAFVKSGKC